MELSEIREQAARAAEEVCAAAKLRVGDLFVVGCSSSEVCGEKIGTHSSVEVAEAVFEGIYSVIEKHGLFLAAQCCEHLNRALIVERAAAEKFGLDEVNVIPQPKAGGSFGTTAYKRFEEPVAVESVKQSASAGMDVGNTLIGMHIKPVVVPLRIETKKIGEAPLVCARRRPKFVGGSRAVYNDELKRGACVSKLKAVFFDLDDTPYTSFQAGDRYAYECMEKWAQETLARPDTASMPRF